MMDPAAYLDQDSLNITQERLGFKLQSRTEGGQPNSEHASSVRIIASISLEELFYDSFTITDQDD